MFVGVMSALIAVVMQSGGVPHRLAAAPKKDRVAVVRIVVVAENVPILDSAVNVESRCLPFTDFLKLGLGEDGIRHNNCSETILALAHRHGTGIGRYLKAEIVSGRNRMRELFDGAYYLKVIGGRFAVVHDDGPKLESDAPSLPLIRSPSRFDGNVGAQLAAGRDAAVSKGEVRIYERRENASHSEHPQDGLKASPPNSVLARLGLPTLLAQVGSIVILGALTVSCVIAGLGDCLLYDRRRRGRGLLLLGLCGLSGGIALCVAFAG